MNFIEALQDIGKGRIVDDGCDYKLIALAKGKYCVYSHFHDLREEITLDGKPGENARALESFFYKFLEKHPFCYGTIQIEYKRK